MVKTTTITLGDQQFTVGRLSIGVLRELDAEMTDKPAEGLSDRKKEEYHFDRAIRCISQALSTVDPKWTVEEVLKIECEDLDEIFQAHRSILYHSGLIKMKATKSGEEQAAA